MMIQGTILTYATIPMSSTNDVWVTTTRDTRASGSGRARTRGSTTKELRVTPLKITALALAASNPPARRGSHSGRDHHHQERRVVRDNWPALRGQRDDCAVFAAWGEARRTGVSG
jgi:hypothetical protein